MHAGAAQSRACRCARRNTVVDHNRCTADDVCAFATAKIKLAPSLDLGVLTYGLEFAFGNACLAYDILIAALARAEAQVGNSVGAENYYQYAEHYFRSMSSDREGR